MFAFLTKKQYANYSDKELLSNFRSESWGKLSPDKRIALLQEVENRNAASQGRTPCVVKSTDSKDEYGCYYPKSNRIEVNVNDYIKNEYGERIENNSYQVLDTIYHEGEHAHQSNCIENQIAPPQGLHQTTRDMCEVENSGNNYKGVIEYDHCTCEVDSNNVAVKKVMEAKDLFQDDKNFDAYLADREDYFKQASNIDMSKVRMQQNEAVYQAYQNGDISLQKHDDILLNEVHSEQPAFSEAKELYEAIRNERSAYQENHQSEETELSRVSSVNNGDSAPGLRERVIHPSIGQTVKIAHNMGDTLRAAEQGYQTVNGLRAERIGQAANVIASTGLSVTGNFPAGQKLIDKTVIRDAAHTYDAVRAIKHPEEQFDFQPRPISEEEKAAHTLEIEMPTDSEKRASFAAALQGASDGKTTVESKRDAFRVGTQEGSSVRSASSSEKKNDFRSAMTEKKTSFTSADASHKKSAENNEGEGVSGGTVSHSNGSGNSVKR